MKTVLFLLAVFISVPFCAFTDELPKENKISRSDIFELPLEELLNITITSVSKKEQPLSSAPAAIFVITNEDIRRLGATTLPEVLRMVPGLQVGQIGAHHFAVSARGFSGLLANKLLILIDGRSVYHPVDSGVYWESQDLVFDNIERIEVIRGPGASLWGSNAVNGVINITTKKVNKDQKGVLTTGLGTRERGFANVSIDRALTNNTNGRIFLKGVNRDSSLRSETKEDNFDAWHTLSGGFRLDTTLEKDFFTLQGDAIHGRAQEELILGSESFPFYQSDNRKTRFSNQNIVGRWQRKDSKSSEITTQVYWDKIRREDAVLEQDIDTVDLDFQHNLHWSENNEVTYGANYRLIQDDMQSSSLKVAEFDDRSATYDIKGAFLQNEAKLSDTLSATIGSKFEHASLSGYNVQPSARLIWAGSESLSVWGAVSKAIRTATRLEQEIKYTFPPVAINQELLATPIVYGDKGFKRENVIVYETGFRYSPISKLSFDSTFFYNKYSKLRTLEPSNLEVTQDRFILPSFADDKAKGNSYGVEVVSEFRPATFWRVQTSYSFLKLDINGKGSLDPLVEEAEKEAPQHQATLRSLIDLPYNVQADSMVRFVDRIPAHNIDSYSELTLRLGWKPTQQMEFSVVGSNLLHRSHEEFVSTQLIYPRAEIPRSVYGQFKFFF